MHFISFDSAWRKLNRGGIEPEKNINFNSRIKRNEMHSHDTFPTRKATIIHKIINLTMYLVLQGKLRQSSKIQNAGEKQRSKDTTSHKKNDKDKRTWKTRQNSQPN